MKYKIALVGNPNSGKTTLFNLLTGSSQYVGNWPGVTVEKKEGILKNMPEFHIDDLPGIYSLAPYSTEEIITRKYLLEANPDLIINIVDSTNLERSLYLTLQLMETGIPLVIALNMTDILEKKGIKVQVEALSNALQVPVIPISSLKNTNINTLVKKVVALVHIKSPCTMPICFDKEVEEKLAFIQNTIAPYVNQLNSRFYAIKVFEKDQVVLKSLQINEHITSTLMEQITCFEKTKDDESSSIIIHQRYQYITRLLQSHQIVHKENYLETSNTIDKIVTHPILALPIFAAVMFLVYFISVTTVGSFLTDYTNDVIFGEYIIPSITHFLAALQIAPWLMGLMVDGIISGVGAVLGFVPQLVVLFLLLALLEECGYMSRIAFILDRLFRKFGLSGKSFIPMLIGTGCSVPGIMASRNIEQEKERRITVITTSFIPCSAKLPLIALIAGALFQNAWWVAPIAYFVGMGAIILSGIILKKFFFAQTQPSAFLMELPIYRLPHYSLVINSAWERSWSFIVKAGTIILLSSIVLWFLQSFGFENNTFTMVEDNNLSLLGVIGTFIAPLFAPLGFGTWQATVSTFTGLIAKENVVSSMGILYGFAEVAENGMEYWTLLAQDFTAISAFSFLLFNLLCAPCFAAIGAIKREMNNSKWTAFAIGYLCGFAYLVSFIYYQLALFISQGVFGILTIIALLCLLGLIYLLFRKPQNPSQKELKHDTRYQPI